MKKVFTLILVALFSIAIFSCSEEEVNPTASQGTTGGVQSEGTEGDF